MLSESGKSVVSVKRDVRQRPPSKQRRFWRHIEGFPGLTLNFVFSKNPRVLTQIENYIYLAHRNRTDDYRSIIQSFDRARGEIFVDSLGRFGTASRWRKAYDLDETDIAAIKKHFPLNAYAAKAVLIELQASWAANRLASRRPALLIDDKEAIAVAETLLTDRKRLAEFIGNRYRANPGQAAMLLAHVQRLAEDTTSQYSDYTKSL